MKCELKKYKLTMATKGESPVEDNPKMRMRENSEKLINDMEEMQKLCKRVFHK